MRHASGSERQRPDDQREQPAERGPFGGHVDAYQGEPTRADYGRHGAPGGYNSERARPTPTESRPEGATDTGSSSPDIAGEAQSDAAGEERAKS
jgi:hypothetical protein